MGMIGNTPYQGQVGSGNIQDGSIDTIDIKDAAVTTAKIGDNQITNGKLADNAVTTAKIGSGQVTNDKLADNAVGTADIQDGAVTSAKIADGTIVSGDLANNAVTTAKIADANVTAGKLASGAAVSNIGYTPVNKAGDSLTGDLGIYHNGNAYLTVSSSDSFNAGFRVKTGSIADYYLLTDGSTRLSIFDSISSQIRWSLDQSGRVTMPYQPAFSVKNAPSTSATNTIIYPSIVLNTGNSYSASTGRFTSPVSGSYYFSVYALANSGNCNIRLRKNGGTVYYSESDESNYHQISVSGIIPLSVGDYVDVEIYTGSTYQNYDNFSGFLIG